MFPRPSGLSTRSIWGIRVYCILQNTCAPEEPLDGPPAQFGQAPRFVGKVNAGHVPAVGVTVSAAVMLIGVLLNYVVPEQVFVWVTSVATVGALWTWAMILIAHMGYRKAVAEGRAQPSPFRMPGSPVTNWIALAFIVLVTLFLTLDPGTRVALYIGPVWFGILALGYRLTKSRELAVA